MIQTLPALVTALRKCPTPSTLGLYKGYDWTKLSTEKFNSKFDIVKNKEWSLSFHRWLADDDKRIHWWQHYEHSFIPIHHPMMIDNVLVRKWEVKTINFESPIVTPMTNGYTMKGHNFSLHLFGRRILPDEQLVPNTIAQAIKVPLEARVGSS